MSLTKMHVKKGDTVVVLSGKDKGKQGKIIQALPKKAQVVVEEVNKVKRHTKPSIPACSKPTRIGHKTVDGKNVRVCKKCGEVVDSAK